MGIALPGAGGATRQSMASGAQVIDGSLKFDKNKTTHVKRTPSSTGNRSKHTFSFWVKYTSNDYAILSCGASSPNYFELKFNSSSQLELFGLNLTSTNTTAVFRDFSAWYHVTLVIDKSNGTATERVIIYVNGVRQALSTASQSDTNDPYWNIQSQEHRIGGRSWSTSDQSDYQLSSLYLIDGQTLTPESFGYTDPLTNTWRPKKFGGNFTQSTSQYTGGTALTWDSSPIGSKWTLSNSNKTATGSGSASYTGGNVWSNAINSNTTYAWTLDITNGDTTGGWYFTDSQSATATHPDELSGNTLGLRGGDSGAGTYGTFASTNGTSDGQDKITGLSSVSPNGTKKIDFVVYRPASGTGKVWVKANLDSTWIGGGNPSDTSSTASFILPDGTTYFAFIGYDTSSTTTLTFAGDGTITSSQGTNSFYLPFDGNSPIGEDKSGVGNNWTPVNFGGSVSLDNPIVSGARPILNTDGGGNVARPGVFGSEVGAYYAVTVASVGGGNRYHFDGVDRPNPTLTRGATYTFDQSDSSNSNHPLRFSTTSNGSHGGGSEYTDGVATNGTPGSAGAYTKITVPHNSADTLYYYCTNHSNMGSSTSQITDETKADPYAWKNVLAISCSGGAYGDRSNLLNCGSTKKSVSGEGDVAAGISTISNFYETSLYFDGTGDRFATDIGSGGLPNDFCIEYWIYADNISGDRGHFQISATNGGLVQSTTSLMVSWGNSEGDTNMYVGNGDVTDIDDSNQNNVWKHYAVVRNSGTLKLYVNGKVAYSASNTVDMTGFRKLCVSGYYNTNFLWKGNMQDFRIYTGIAKYTSEFVVASTNPDILPDTPSGVSGSSKLVKVTDGAVSFDGTGDFLSIADSADFTFGTGDFTIEYFVYISKDQNASHIAKYGTSNASRSFKISTTTLPFIGLAFYWYSGSTQYSMTYSEGSMRPQEGWKHIAIQRKSGDIYQYIDGQMVKSETGSDAAVSINDTTESLIIGSDGNTGSEQPLNGFISNVRIIKGTAHYNTLGFTPPTRELTNVTNTKLLCCQSNTLAGSAAVAPNVSGVNDGTVWSTLTSGGAVNASYPMTQTFDGSTSTTGVRAVSGGGFIFGGSLGISYSSSIRQQDSLWLYKW